MGRASKLLKKTKSLESKVRTNFTRLQKHEAVSDIEMKQPTKEVKSPLKEVEVKAVDQFLEENQELMTELASQEQEEALQELVEQSEDLGLYEEPEESEEAVEAFMTKARILERIDYSYPDGTDYGLAMTLPAGIITASEIRSGDEVVICSGILEGRSLEIIEVINTKTLRLDDVSTYSEQESDVKIRFTIN